MICGSGGSKSRLAKAAGAEPAGQMRDGKLHAVVARSTFLSQNVQNRPLSDHFWTLKCRKSGHRCGAKHVSKSKCTKHLSLGPLLEVEMSKKCTRLWREVHLEVKTTKHLSLGPLFEVEMSKKCTLLWREAHLEVKMYKPHVRATFGSSDVEKVHAVVARSTFQSQSVKSTRVSDHFWRFRCRFASLHYITLHYTPLHCTAVNYTTLHYITLHYTTTLHYTPLHSTTLPYTPLHSTTLHYTK